MNVCLANDHAFFLKRAPRRDVSVVIERSDEDFVAGLEVTANRAGEREGDRRHVLAEDDFVFVTVKEIGHGGAACVDGCVIAAAVSNAPPVLAFAPRK